MKMYRDYVKQLKGNSIIANAGDELVILELKWLGLYDYFMEGVADMQSRGGRLTDYEKAISEKVNREHDQIQTEMYGKPVEGPSGYFGAMVVYVAQFNRLYVFQYHWGFPEAKDNGFSSQNAPYNEGVLQTFLSLSGANTIKVIEGSLPVFKNYHIANRKLNGVDYSYEPIIKTIDNPTPDEIVRFFRKHYG